MDAVDNVADRVRLYGRINTLWTAIRGLQNRCRAAPILPFNAVVSGGAYGFEQATNDRLC